MEDEAGVILGTVSEIERAGRKSSGRAGNRVGDKGRAEIGREIEWQKSSAGLIERGKEKREGNRGEAGELTERRSGSRRGGHSDLAASRIFPSARNGVACASLLVREDPPRGHAHLRRPCGPAHLRRPLGPASSAPPRGGASAGRQPRAAAAPCTSSVSLRPRATPARLQWPGNSISNLSSLCSAGMLLCFMPLLVACGVMY